MIAPVGRAMSRRRRRLGRRSSAVAVGPTTVATSRRSRRSTADAMSAARSCRPSRPGRRRPRRRRRGRAAPGVDAPRPTADAGTARTTSARSQAAARSGWRSSSSAPCPAPSASPGESRGARAIAEREQQREPVQAPSMQLAGMRPAVHASSDERGRREARSSCLHRLGVDMVRWCGPVRCWGRVYLRPPPTAWEVRAPTVAPTLDNAGRIGVETLTNHLTSAGCLPSARGRPPSPAPPASSPRSSRSCRSPTSSARPSRSSVPARSSRASAPSTARRHHPSPSRPSARRGTASAAASTATSSRSSCVATASTSARRCRGWRRRPESSCPSATAGEDRRRRRLREALEAAIAWYREVLLQARQAERARAYLAERGSQRGDPGAVRHRLRAEHVGGADARGCEPRASATPS